VETAAEPVVRRVGEAAALRSLGLPAELVPRDAWTLWDLVDQLGELPPAEDVDAAAEGVIAVVGEGGSAVAAARQLARRLGADPKEVLAAGRDGGDGSVPPWLFLSDERDAAARRSRWARRGSAMIVAVQTGHTAADREWTASLVRALAPHQVRATVEAWRPVDEVREWVEDLPKVDAVDVVGIDAATEPAAVLKLGLPVATLDGHLATPGLWTAVLTGRMNHG
jgi:hypothetical protein